MRMSDYFGLPDVTTLAAHHFSFLPKFKGCEPETIHSEKSIRSMLMRFGLVKQIFIVKDGDSNLPVAIVEMTSTIWKPLILPRGSRGSIPDDRRTSCSSRTKPYSRPRMLAGVTPNCLRNAAAKWLTLV